MTKLKCRICGHEWMAMDATHHRQIMTAAKINHQAPLCHLCLHLYMACVYARNRGFNSLRHACFTFSKLFPTFWRNEPETKAQNQTVSASIPTPQPETKEAQ